MTESIPGSSDQFISRELIQDLYARDARELWSIFYAKCADHSTADDVLSEAFTRLLAHRGKSIRNPRAWLLRVGNNLIVDQVRREKRFRPVAIGIDHECCEAAATSDPLSRDVRDLVRDSLRDLC